VIVDEAIQNRVRTVLAPLRVVYGAMMGSVLIYWIVVQVIRKIGQIPRGRDIFVAVDWLRYPLYVLGMAACVAVVVMRRKLFDADVLRRRARGRELPEILSSLSSSQILVFAVAEIPVILGLALYFVGGYLLDFYVLAGLSLVGFALAFPSAVDWASALLQLRACSPELFSAQPPPDRTTE
jgi:heme exporter protein D